MDYIQNDLDLIRKAAEGTVGADKEKKRVQRKKIAKIAGSVKDDLPRGGKGSRTQTAKKRPSTLARKSVEKNVVKKSQKVKKIVKSTSASLKKIKLPAMKKQTPLPTEKPAVKLGRRATKVAAKEKKTEAAEAVLLPPAVATKSRKSLDPNAVPIEAIHFDPGAKIEAVDHGQWYKAKIVEVDNEKMDILVHFDGWGAKFDTWFPMTSTLIRGRTQLDAIKNIPTYEPGEDVLARWTDGNFYPATVISVNKSGSCQVMYFDGMKKLIRPNLIKKMSDKEKEEAMQAAQKLLLIPPTDLGSPLSPTSTGSPSSDGRKYKTSANDRERRSAARSGPAVPGKGPITAAAPPKRGTKRRSAAQMSTSEPPVSRAITPLTVKNFPVVENSRAKKPRLNQITTDFTSQVSPTSESTQKKTAVNATSISRPGPKARDQLGAKGPRVGGRRGRPLKRQPPTPTVEKTDIQSLIIKDGGTSGQRDLPATKEPRKSSNGGVVTAETIPQQAPTSSGYEVAEPILLEKKAGMPGDEGKLSESSTGRVLHKIKSSEAASMESSDTDTRTYKTGDTVLAKWADCRSYLAYIIKKEQDDSYKIRYYDGMVKVVKSAFIYPWMGSLPERLKEFKPKPAKIRKRRSIDFAELGRSRGTLEARTPEVKVTSPGSFTKIQRRRTAPPATRTDAPPPARGRRRTDSNETPISEGTIFKKGERVIAKWTDLRWYPATIVSKQDNDHYKVRYTDDLIKTVRDTWLNSWSPPVKKGSSKTKAEDAKTESEKEVVSKFAENSQQKKPVNAPNDQQVNEGEAMKDEALQEKNERASSPAVTTTCAKVATNASGKKWKRYFPGNMVLARYTNGRSYPATIKELLKDGTYIVEYDNGIRITAKSSMFKPWSATALPPLSMFHRKKSFTTTQAVTPQMKSLVPAQIKTPDAKEKPARQLSAKPGQLPRQVVRGYDAYYARFPAQVVVEEHHHKFKCRVPGCTKSFRKEEILRQHHKNFHQQRYKLRDHDGQSSSSKRKPSKEDGVRRRVSADYETAAKVQSARTPKVAAAAPKEIPSRGAKPPIDVYQQQQGKVDALSSSSALDSSSGVEETKTKDNEVPVETAKPKVSSVAEKKIPEQAPDKVIPIRRSKRTRTGSMELKDRVECTDAKEEITKKQPGETEKSLEAAEEAPEAVNEDVIRCSCDVEEEEGFMIQCEGCFTWQHTACVGVDQPEENNQAGRKKNESGKGEIDKSQSATEVTKRHGISEGYTCWVCKNPENVRKSKKFLYNNDFLTKGRLPSLTNLTDVSKEAEANGNVDAMMLSSLMDAVIKMQEALHGIKQKIKVATTPGDHPLLKTWKAKPTSDKGVAATPGEGQQAAMPEEVGETKEEKSTSGNAEAAARPCQGASPKGKARANGKKGRHSPSLSGESQEALVRDCRENLLDHVLELESVLDNRITRLTEFVSRLESMDGDDTEDTDWLHQDLKAVQKLLSNC